MILLKYNEWILLKCEAVVPVSGEVCDVVVRQNSVDPR